MSNRSGTHRALVETLEKRSLLSGAVHNPVSAAEEPDLTPPTLVKEQLLGTDPRQVAGVVLTFSEPLDPVSAQDLKNYRVGRRTDQKQNYDPNFNHVEQEAFKDGLIRFTSAVYDPATLTVTLTPVEPFNITRKFRTIRVLARGPNRAVKDLAGNILDGDGNGKPTGDAVHKYTFRRAQRVQYEELDGDKVTIWLTGPGRLWVLRETPEGKVFGRGSALRLYVDKTDTSAIVTGKVEGDGPGVAVIDELINAYGADVQITQSAVFQILKTIP